MQLVNIFIEYKIENCSLKKSVLHLERKDLLRKRIKINRNRNIPSHKI